MKPKGFLLAAMLCIIPVALIMVFTLSGTLLQQSSMTILAMRKNKAFYLGQAALATGYQIFGLNNHTGHTHESDGLTQTNAADVDFLDSYSTPGLTVDSGWYRWRWNPGDPPALSYSRSGAYETYRFKVFLPAANSWKIVCEATVDNVVSHQEMGGSLAPVYDYMVFDNGESSDFARAEQHLVTGKIHANGNLYLRPWSTEGFRIDLGPPAPLGIHVVILDKQEPARLNIDAASVSSARRIVRHKDGLGNADPGGELQIANSAAGLSPTWMEGKDQGQIGPGNAFDSYHPAWRSTAIAKYQGTVTDSELGAKKLTIPRRGALEPGGYYDQRAGLRIDSSTSGAWISDKTFYNQSEAREVTVKELDVAAMISANQMPANGVLYSEVPIRLVNAHSLPGKLTVASQATIYTRGDFNKDNPDGSGSDRRQAAALLTSDRIYNLTSSFDDTRSYTYANPANIASPPAKASDPPLYPGDDDNVLEINAARTDGAPTADERAWVNDPANPYFVPGDFPHPITGKPTGVKAIPDAHDPASAGLKVAFPAGDDLLENMQQVRLKVRGTITHMRNAKMARYDNSDADATITPWIVKSAYIPPKNRDFTQDPKLASMEDGPPLAPRAARKLFWHEIR